MEERLLHAISLLSALRDEAYRDGSSDQYRWEDYIRLSGKIEGVKLALEYIRQGSLNG